MINLCKLLMLGSRKTTRGKKKGAEEGTPNIKIGGRLAEAQRAR
jgi:hypothetical protein